MKIATWPLLTLISFWVFAVGAIPSAFAAETSINIVNHSGKKAFVKFTSGFYEATPSQVEAVSYNSSNGIPSGQSAQFKVKSLSSGRIYLSYDKKLSGNKPDGANSHDTNYKTRFGWVELTYLSDGSGNINLAAGDFYAIPMTLETLATVTDSRKIICEYFSLSPGVSGNNLKTNINKILQNQNAIVKNDKGEWIRTLSPVKSPASYPTFDAIVDKISGLSSTKIQITGKFFGANPASPYDYTSSINKTNISLISSDKKHTIAIPISSLKYDKTDLKKHNGIYTCNGPFTVDRQNWDMAKNDVYCAVYRDLLAALNIGVFKAGAANGSDDWWKAKPFPAGSACNKYAKAITENYAAYGFPFSERGGAYVLGTLSKSISDIVITVLDDNTKGQSRPAESGYVNPQSGGAKINLSFFPKYGAESNAKICFNTKNYTCNFIQDKPFQINDVPVREGDLNIYDFIISNLNYKGQVYIYPKTNGPWAGGTGGLFGNTPWKAGNGRWVCFIDVNKPPQTGFAGEWEGHADLGGGWKWSDWFGSYNILYAPWIYHFQHGWLYVFDRSTSNLTFWEHQRKLFWWTSDTAYPMLYDHGKAAWYWYDATSSTPRWFYNYATGLWESDATR